MIARLALAYLGVLLLIAGTIALIGPRRLVAGIAVIAAGAVLAAAILAGWGVIEGAETLRRIL